MNAYKSGITDNNIRVLITLFIPVRAKTNMERKNIINKKYAKYRSNIAYVLSIRDDNEIEYRTAKSAFWNEKIIYTVCEMIQSEFDENINLVLGKGIHFFIDPQMAYNYNRKIFEQIWNVKNLFQTFYSNGSPKERIKYNLINQENSNENDKIILSKNVSIWFENGYKKSIENYISDKRNGVFNEWYYNGQIKSIINYLDDSKHGVEKKYYQNGNKQSIINYYMDVYNGEYKTWYPTGVINEEYNYNFGKEKDINIKWNNGGRINVYKKYSDNNRNTDELDNFKEINNNSTLRNRLIRSIYLYSNDIYHSDDISDI
jgi:antitoxin component YwqK of YwqJK toxin-antitoxin module